MIINTIFSKNKIFTVAYNGFIFYLCWNVLFLLLRHDIFRRQCSSLNQKQVSPSRLYIIFSNWSLSVHSPQIRRRRASSACKSSPLQPIKYFFFPSQVKDFFCGFVAVKWKENSHCCAGERCHLFSVLAAEEIRKQMGQGRSEGHAMADRFVYLACLWYPAFPLHSPRRPSLKAWPGSDHVGVDQGHFSPVSQHQPPHSPLGATQNIWDRFGLIGSLWQNSNWLICGILAVSLDSVGCWGGKVLAELQKLYL